ncbi:hypothetical protein EGW08_022804, partial [Elysia chlorotica]
ATPIVGVICFVVHDKSVFNKVETVRSRLTSIHPLTCIFTKFRKLVYMLHSVAAVRNAKPKLKIKALEHSVSEIVLLYHAELVHWFVSHNKLN